MKDIENIFKALQTFPSRTVILYDANNDETITFKDVIDCVKELKIENEKLNDMKFTQEHCNLYEENEWLKDILKQYMDGELINEDVFCQQVKEIQEVRQYTAQEIFDSIFETLCVFTTQDKSEEYNEGFLAAVSEIDERLQKLAKEKGVEVE